MEVKKAFCPHCKKEESMTYEVSLKEIHGGDYEYGTFPGCTIVIEWTCENDWIVEREEFEL